MQVWLTCRSQKFERRFVAARGWNAVVTRGRWSE
jgi:hypothetical protein